MVQTAAADEFEIGLRIMAWFSFSDERGGGGKFGNENGSWRKNMRWCLYFHGSRHFRPKNRAFFAVADN